MSKKAGYSLIRVVGALRRAKMGATIGGKCSQLMQCGQFLVGKECAVNCQR
jgi:hypothetical protein